MARYGITKGLRALVWATILISCATYTGCKLSMGGDSVDPDDDVSFAVDIERVSIATAGTQGDDDAFTLSLSSNGNFVAFGSFATNLVSNDTNGFLDIFVMPNPAFP